MIMWRLKPAANKVRDYLASWQQIFACPFWLTVQSWLTITIFCVN